MDAEGGLPSIRTSATMALRAGSCGHAAQLEHGLPCCRAAAHPARRLRPRPPPPQQPPPPHLQVSLVLRLRLPHTPPRQPPPTAEITTSTRRRAAAAPADLALLAAAARLGKVVAKVDLAEDLRQGGRGPGSARRLRAAAAAASGWGALPRPGPPHQPSRGLCPHPRSPPAGSGAPASLLLTGLRHPFPATPHTTRPC